MKNYVAIPLSKEMVALISPADETKVKQFKWYASQEGRNGLKFYAIRKVMTKGRSKKIRMHRFIMGLGTGFEDSRVVHHKNDDGLDNRRENLEILETNHQNMCMTHGWRVKKKEVPFL